MLKLVLILSIILSAFASNDNSLSEKKHNKRSYGVPAISTVNSDWPHPNLSTPEVHADVLGLQHHGHVIAPGVHQHVDQPVALAPEYLGADIHTTITKNVAVPVPVAVEKRVPVAVKVPVVVPVDRPIPYPVYKPYAVPIEKPVPIHVDRPIPYFIPQLHHHNHHAHLLKQHYHHLKHPVLVQPQAHAFKLIWPSW